LECFDSASFDVRVPVSGGGGLRLREEVPSLLDVAESAALDEHLPPREVGAGREELGFGPFLERGGFGEVRVGVVVAAEYGREKSWARRDGRPVLLARLPMGS
jgi:hypothetical protein